jgi:hypothetical protein
MREWSGLGVKGDCVYVGPFQIVNGSFTCIYIIDGVVRMGNRPLGHVMVPFDGTASVLDTVPNCP